jgi:predicted DNA-binding antitoxin AbrB/MazE fold protein
MIYGAANMINSVEAVYEKGVFRPLLAIPELSEGQRVRIAVEFSRDADTEEMPAKAVVLLKNNREMQHRRLTSLIGSGKGAFDRC